MWWVRGTLVPTGPGRRLAKGAQGRLPLPRVRQDGHPRPPPRRNGLRDKVTPAKQYQTIKPGPRVGRFFALLSTLESPTLPTKGQSTLRLQRPRKGAGDL